MYFSVLVSCVGSEFSGQSERNVLWVSKRASASNPAQSYIAGRTCRFSYSFFLWGIYLVSDNR